MYLGFSFERADAAFSILDIQDPENGIDTYESDHGDFFGDAEEKFGALAASSPVPVLYQALGFDKICYVLCKPADRPIRNSNDLEMLDIPNTITNNTVNSIMRDHSASLHALRQHLIKAGLQVECEWGLITEPDWTRHGECLNYD